MSTKQLLTDAHHRQIIDAERAITEAMEIMDGLEACDADCQQLREVAAALKDRLAKLRANFLPKTKK